MVNIFIANLDWEITSEDLKATFSSFGAVHYAHVVFDNKTKRSKGFGYVEMESTDEAINAIEALNGMEVNGRKIDVKIASPKGNRPLLKKVEPKPTVDKSTGSNDSRGAYGKSDNYRQRNDDRRPRTSDRRSESSDDRSNRFDNNQYKK